jgi:2-C-methyl-D-erythritol 4-phosphate cytidylyltransferase
VRLALAAGYKVRLVQGDFANLKLTRPEDLLFAEFMLSQRRFDIAE